MSKIILSCDSSSDIPKELLEKYDIHLTPLHIILGEEEYLDGVDIYPDYIFKYYDENGILPKTTAISPGEYIKYFEEMKGGDEESHIIHFNLASRISSSFQNAKMAEESVKNLHVINTKNLSGGSGILVHKAQDYINQGLSVDEIIKKIKDLIPRVNTSFVVDSLKYIEEGGRIPKGTTKGANLFKIKAKLRVYPEENGKISLERVYRGDFERTLFKYLRDVLKDKENIFEGRMFIIGTNPCISDEKLLSKIKESLYENGINDVYIQQAGCTISSHCGPNTLGFIYINKE